MKKTSNQKDINDFIEEMTLEDCDFVRSSRLRFLEAKKEKTLLELHEWLEAFSRFPNWFYRVSQPVVIKPLLAQLKKLNAEIEFYVNPRAKDYEKSGISEEDIERAKEYPIDQIVKFNKVGFIKCLWHAEKTPSLKYWKKENKVHCFGCDRTEDSIGFVQQYYNCSFQEAIKFLTNQL